MPVLVLDVSGTPRSWVSHDHAITYHSKNQVIWYLGDVIARYHGGIQDDGRISYLESTSIIAVQGEKSHSIKNFKVNLTNKTLFARDRNICGYCGDHFKSDDLSRDHIMPTARGGIDDWMNVVTSCRKCNHKKGCRTPDECSMPLIYLPYVPNHYEHMILQNRSILSDQMEYLMSGVPKHSRIKMAA